MLKKPLFKATTMAVAVSAAMVFASLTQAQSSAAGTAGSDASGAAVSGGGTGTSGMGTGASGMPDTAGTAGTTGTAGTPDTTGTAGATGTASTGGAVGARGARSRVNPAIANDSIYPDPQAGTTTGAKARKSPGNRSSSRGSSPSGNDIEPAGTGGMGSSSSASGSRQ